MPITRAYAQAAEPGNFFVAGKNKIINGDFRINQRAFTSNTTAGSYNFDRWFQDNDGGTVTCTPQTFTLGAAPVAGYEGTTFLRQVTASQTLTSHYAQIRYKIESVRTLAGETATLSFWAKAASGTPKIAPLIQQNFGTGGSPSATVNTVGSSVTLSTSWARYSVTISVPSISGKTLGTANNDFLGVTFWTSAGSDYNSLTNSLGLQNNTFDIWGVQLEAGAVATPFTTATGTLAGELAACQRYYYRATSTTSPYGFFGNGVGYTTGELGIALTHPVTMRTEASALDTSAMNTFLMEQHATSNVNTPTSIIIDTGASNVNNTMLAVTKSASFTLGAIYRLLGNNSTSAYIGVSAEL
jgi:hypothetical protein